MTETKLTEILPVLEVTLSTGRKLVMEDPCALDCREAELRIGKPMEEWETLKDFVVVPVLAWVMARHKDEELTLDMLMAEMKPHEFSGEGGAAIIRFFFQRFPVGGGSSTTESESVSE